jgi:TP901 family phage tail tape measure protein
MDVNVPQAETLLTHFAKAAVAGQVDVQTAGRATVAIMNAYKVPVEQASDVMDFQFQLVRKGVGTYQEFASSLGRVLPSARRAGQDLNNLGGVMAFLTRNGLSTSLAATSAARSFDNLANSKVQKNMADLGVQVLDSSGNIRQMSDIVTDLAGKLDGLTDAQKAAKLDAIFKGAGNNIQARRFWDLAIRNFTDLNTLTDDMVNKSGSLENAYKIMFEQPAAQAQLLKNNLQALKIGIGQALIPIFMEAVKWLTKVVQWFNNLDASTKAIIAKIALFGSAALVVIGVLASLIGIVRILHGSLELAGGAFNALKLLFAVDPVVLVVLAAIAAIAYVIYRNWDTLKKWWADFWPVFQADAQKVLDWLQAEWAKLWPKIQETAAAVWTWLQENWPKIWAQIQATAKRVWDWLKNAWDIVWKDLQTAWKWMQQNIPPIAQAIWNAVQTAWNAIVTATGAVVDAFNTFITWLQTAWDWFANVFGPGFVNVWNNISQNVGPIIHDIYDILNGLWTNVLSPLATTILSVLVPAFQTAWADIQIIVTLAIQTITTVLQVWWDFVVAVWNGIRDSIVPLIQDTWNNITQIIDAALTIIRGIFDVFAGVFTGDWSRVWEGIKTIFEGIWNGFAAIVDQAWTAMKFVWDLGMAVLKAIWKTFWDDISKVVSQIWEDIKNFVDIGINNVKTIISTIGDLIKGAWDAFWNGLSSKVEGVVNAIVGFVQGMIDKVHEAVSALVKLASSPVGPGSGGLLTGGIDFSHLIPGTASGGGVEAGKIITRNEFGRELFVPSVRGTLFTAPTTKQLLSGTAASASRTVNIHEGAFAFHIAGDNVEGNRRMVRQELERFLIALGRA